MVAPSLVTMTWFPRPMLCRILSCSHSIALCRSGRAGLCRGAVPWFLQTKINRSLACNQSCALCRAGVVLISADICAAPCSRLHGWQDLPCSASDASLSLAIGRTFATKAPQTAASYTEGRTCTEAQRQQDVQPAPQATLCPMSLQHSSLAQALALSIAGQAPWQARRSMDCWVKGTGQGPQQVNQETGC